MNEHEEPNLSDRLPPHDIPSEEGVLGCCLLEPVASIPQCIEFLRDGSYEFYDLRHQQIYETLLELYDDQVGIDVISLQDRLKTWNKLDQVGGLGYITTLPDIVPSASNLPTYLDIVHEKYLLRRSIQACMQAVQRIYDVEADANGCLDRLESDLISIRNTQERAGEVTVREYVRQAIVHFEEMLAREGAVGGIATGFNDFDRLTDGLHGSEMIVLAGRPSTGKTSLAMNVAAQVALVARIPVGVFSLEMSGQSLIERMICSEARVNLRNLRDGFVANRDFPRITHSAGRISGAPLFINDEAGLSIMQLRAKARRMHGQHGIRLFVIDYLQLMNARGSVNRGANREQEVTAISQGVKNLAKELNVPIITIAQLNRDIERDKHRIPRLSDLRESGSLEQDADTVGILYRPRTKSDDEETPIPLPEEPVPVNLAILKQRNGPTGEVLFTFLKSYTRFESAARVADADVPEQQEFYNRQSNDP